MCGKVQTEDQDTGLTLGDLAHAWRLEAAVELFLFCSWTRLQAALNAQRSQTGPLLSLRFAEEETEAGCGES